ncbi:hypothetical protein [Thalassobacillus hwangdonensis]|uniref:DUF4179 domain-containing protein n=1 Tax=Thalassobacillus hwangdonensis TaxID=546108 RepID=A0ABW3L1F4_9BACI
MNEKEKRNTPKLKLWLSLGVVVLLFIGTQLVMESPAETEALPPQKEKKEETEIPEVLSNVRVAESEEEVYEFFRENTPGLARAEEHGAVKELNQSAKVPDREGNFYLDRIWYDSHFGYLFTGYDLSFFKGVEDLPEERYSFIRGLHLDPMDEDTKKEIGNPHLNFSNFTFLEKEAIIYDGRLYQKGGIAPLIQMGQGYQPIEKVDALFSAGFALTMPDTLEMKRVEFPLQIKHDVSDELIEQIPIDQKLAIGDTTLVVKRMDMKLGYDSIVVETEGTEHALMMNTRGKVITGNGEETYFYLQNQSDGQEDTYEMIMMPLKSDPNQIDIQFDSIQLASEDSYSFRIDLQKHLEGKEMADIFTVPVDKKIKEAYGTEVIIESVEYGSQDVTVHIDYETSETSPTRLSTDLIPAFVQLRDRDMGNLLSAKDDNGEDLKSIHGGGGPNDPSISMQFSRYLNKEKQYLDIMVDRLVYEVTDTDKITVEMP